MRKLTNFLIASIVPILAGLIYTLFEADLLRALAALPQNTNQKIIVRTILLSVLLVILILSYFLQKYRYQNKRLIKIKSSFKKLESLIISRKNETPLTRTEYDALFAEEKKLEAEIAELEKQM
jgi:hypothetical protein